MLSDLIILLFVAMYSLIPNYKLGKSISNEVLLNRLEEEFLKGFPNAGVLFSFKYNIYIAKYRKQTNVAQNKPSCNYPQIKTRSGAPTHCLPEHPQTTSSLPKGCCHSASSFTLVSNVGFITLKCEIEKQYKAIWFGR